MALQVTLVSPLDEEEAFTEEQRHQLVQPPAKQRDKWHPEEQELGTQVGRTRLSEDVQIRRRAGEVVHAGANEESDGEDCIGGEGHNWKEDNAEALHEKIEHARRYHRGEKAEREKAHSSCMLSLVRKVSTLLTSRWERFTIDQ